ncbi:hypothetical protein F5Y16DRAFT_414336 [Xylariaceae sp. FL0255]|nr:hypothetical protein F5Y16DRAFT_414336 [Xylariaceae sp. FL0255]
MKQDHSRLQPDGGAISLVEDMEGTDAFEEHFPKEIKTAYNWSSQALRNGELTDAETGEWIGSKGQSNRNAPIRQAYTYCVNYRCRYGCILTTEEAFIFRIRPRENPSGEAHDIDLLEQVKFHGLMEFVSVPWGNGCEKLHHEYRQWTVNLALWFTHVLAGNSHKLDWGYKRLCEERLVEGEQQETQHHVTRTIEKRLSQTVATPTKKRKHAQEQAQDRETPDLASVSFSQNPMTQPDPLLGSYADSSDDQSDATVYEDLESPPMKRRLVSA